MINQAKTNICYQPQKTACFGVKAILRVLLKNNLPACKSNSWNKHSIQCKTDFQPFMTV